MFVAEDMFFEEIVDMHRKCVSCIKLREYHCVDAACQRKALPCNISCSLNH